MYSICTPFVLQYLQLSVHTFSSQAFFITSKALSPPLSSTSTLSSITPLEGRKSFLPSFSFERLSYIVLHSILTVQYFFIFVVVCVIGAVVEGLVVAGFVVVVVIIAGLVVVGFVVVIGLVVVGLVVVTFEVVCFFVVVGFVVVAFVVVCCLVVADFVVVVSVVEYAVVDSVVATDAVTTVAVSVTVTVSVVASVSAATELLSGTAVLVGKAVVAVVGAVDVSEFVGSSVSPQAVNVKIIRRIQIKTLNFFIFYSKENIPYFILSRLNLSVIGLLIKKSRIPVVMP